MKHFNKGTLSSRHVVAVDRSECSRKSGVKKLTSFQKIKSGRNNTGQIVVRHRGGGVARRLRSVSWNASSGSYKVLRLEYDPTRSSWLALLADSKGKLSYRIAPSNCSSGSNMDVWSTLHEAMDSSPDRYTGERSVQRHRSDGSVTLPIKYIPSGTSVHGIERSPGMGPLYARTAGSKATLYRTDKEGYVHIVLPSGESRYFPEDCLATFGSVGVENHKLEVLGKAGRRRNKGFRPRVRGVAMSHHDHPMGGGEGRSSGGQPSVSFTGKLVHWNPTRSRKKKKNDKLLISRRSK